MAAWQGRTAVVTGVARPNGIGNACARALWCLGFNVVGIDSQAVEVAGPANEEEGGVPWTSAAADAEDTAAAPAAPRPAPGQPRCVALQVDLAQPEQIRDVPQRLRQLGASSVSVLVNNAAIVDPYLPPPGAPASAGERARLWGRCVAVNLTAPFLLSEALLPLLAAEGGAGGSATGAAAGQPPPPPRGSSSSASSASSSSSSIIHISSTRALQSEPNCEAYGATKAGLVGLAHAQAASLAPLGIRVNAVLPGWIDTSLSAEEGQLRPEDHAWHWAGRVGRPADVAELVAFLADGAKAGFITGQQFVVDGGVSRRMVYPE